VQVTGATDFLDSGLVARLADYDAVVAGIKLSTDLFS
jgi:hypothetical protein